MSTAIQKYARTASEFGYLPLEHTLAVAEAVVTTQRDWGNRTDRKNAKTKYALERVGVDTFKAEVERRAGITLNRSVRMSLPVVAIVLAG